MKRKTDRTGTGNRAAIDSNQRAVRTGESVTAATERVDGWARNLKLSLAGRGFSPR